MPVAKEKRRERRSTDPGDGEQGAQEGGKAWSALGGGRGAGEKVGKGKRLAPGTVPSTVGAVSSVEAWI